MLICPFQHTATRRWLLRRQQISRQTAAFQHTATRRWLRVQKLLTIKSLPVSTHSHPKVAAAASSSITSGTGFQHTATRRWLHGCDSDRNTPFWFQHTATRRWLRRLSLVFGYLTGFNTQPPEGGCMVLAASADKIACFNTQPPEGGCDFGTYGSARSVLFQHTATRRWLRKCRWRFMIMPRFNTQPPEGGCSLPQKPCSIRFRSPDFAKLPRKA